MHGCNCSLGGIAYPAQPQPLERGQGGQAVYMAKQVDGIELQGRERRQATWAVRHLQAIPHRPKVEAAQRWHPPQLAQAVLAASEE